MRTKFTRKDILDYLTDNVQIVRSDSGAVYVTSEDGTIRTHLIYGGVIQVICSEFSTTHINAELLSEDWYVLTSNETPKNK